MAEASISVAHDQFRCPLCLDLLKDPVTLHCGHNICKNELKEEQLKSQQRIQEKQKKVQELKQAVVAFKVRSQAAVNDSEKIFTEMISFMEWRGDVYISVSYKEISRKGRGYECRFGFNNQSWSLMCSPPSVSFWHDKVNTLIRGPASSRIGVYVDHSAGTLSFYSISDTMSLLHTVQTTFTQPLYAGFWVSSYTSSVRLCDAK